MVTRTVYELLYFNPHKKGKRSMGFVLFYFIAKKMRLKAFKEHA